MAYLPKSPLETRELPPPPNNERKDWVVWIQLLMIACAVRIVMIEMDFKIVNIPLVDQVFEAGINETKYQLYRFGVLDSPY